MRKPNQSCRNHGRKRPQKNEKKGFFTAPKAFGVHGNQVNEASREWDEAAPGTEDGGWRGAGLHDRTVASNIKYLFRKPTDLWFPGRPILPAANALFELYL